MAAVAVGGSRRRRLRYVTERRGFLATLLISPAVLFIGALVGAPLVLAIYLSFTDATAGSLSGPWLGLGNFRHELNDPIFVDAIWHTFLFTAISQAVVIVCAGLLAHALVHKFRGRWVLRFFVLLPWAAPIALTAMGFLWFYDTQASIFTWFLVKLHLVSATNHPSWLGTPRAAMSSIITVQAWRTIPFATVIFLAGIASIPQEVDDAAAIDGATGLRKFWYVSLPLQLPIALVAILFGIVFTGAVARSLNRSAGSDDERVFGAAALSRRIQIHRRAVRRNLRDGRNWSCGGWLNHSRRAAHLCAVRIYKNN